jgi:drug/metabolite transporter (DMT)-like permease
MIFNKSKAVIYMLLSALSFAFMSAFVKLAGDIPLFEKVFVRNLISLIIAFLVIIKSKRSMLGKKENRRFLLMRSSFGLIGVILYFYSINNLYLADSSMLNKISPFFVTFFAGIFLKERIRKFQIVALFVIFGASLLIIKPKYDLSILPAISGFTAAIFAGAAYTTVRFLGGKEQPQTIVFWFSAVSVLVMFPLMLINFKVPDGMQVIYLLGTGLFAAGGQFGLTLAYKFAEASKVAIYNYANIIFAVIIGYFIWSEIPDFLSIVGGILIILTSIAIFVNNLNKT